MAYPDYRRFVHPIAGNIDLSARPLVPDGDGYATVRSLGIGTDRGETLIPTVHPDGYIMSDLEAIDRYDRTGQHLGVFSTPSAASHYAERLHRQQADQYGNAIRALLGR
jgi:hypothetical protein